MNPTENPPCDELFDSVVQSIFGIGLKLEHCLNVTGDPATRAWLDESIQSLHAIIGRVRERGDLHCDAPDGFQTAR